MQADGDVLCADAGTRRRFGRCGVVEERRDEALDAETAQPPVVQYASAPRPMRRWSQRLLSLLCTVMVVYVFADVFLMTGDGQAGLALVLYSPLCALPGAFFFARYETDLIGAVLCAASAALGVVVGGATYGLWAVFSSVGAIVSALLSALPAYAIVYAAAFVVACLAASLGFALGRFERPRRRRQYVPYSCPACGHFLLGVKGPTCPKCRRPFTIEELRAAAGDE